MESSANLVQAMYRSARIAAWISLATMLAASIELAALGTNRVLMASPHVVALSFVLLTARELMSASRAKLLLVALPLASWQPVVYAFRAVILGEGGGCLLEALGLGLAMAAPVLYRLREDEVEVLEADELADE